jgi:hypothetical protein
MTNLPFKIKSKQIIIVDQEEIILERDQVLNLEYHKGELCGYTSALCQEGFCSECIINLERGPHAMPRFSKNKERTQEKSFAVITAHGVNQKNLHTNQPAHNM